MSSEAVVQRLGTASDLRSNVGRDAAAATLIGPLEDAGLVVLDPDAEATIDCVVTTLVNHIHLSSFREVAVRILADLKNLP